MIRRICLLQAFFFHLIYRFNKIFVLFHLPNSRAMTSRDNLVAEAKDANINNTEITPSNEPSFQTANIVVSYSCSEHIECQDKEL